MRVYGIYARVVDVSEIERVSAANEWDFWYKNECVNTVRDSHHFGGLFISNLSRMLKFAATHCEMTTKSKYQPIGKNACRCEATRLRSRLIQVGYVTSLGCLCPKPTLFESFGCKYVSMYAFHRICLDFKYGPRNRGCFVRSESIQRQNQENTHNSNKGVMWKT